jgi:hypothetical protein
MDIAVTWTDEWQVYLVGAQLVLLIVAAVVASWQVWEARKLRLQQDRPFVVIDFEVENSNLIYLEIANLGTSLARHVTIAIEPPLRPKIGVQFDKMKMLNEGIPTLAPGKRIKTLFDIFSQRDDDDGLPLTHRAKLTYTDEDRGRKFDDEFVLDLELYRYLSTVTRHTIHDLYKQIEQLNKTLKGWSANIGRGMVAMSYEEAKAREDEIVKGMEEREREDDEATPESKGEDS